MELEEDFIITVKDWHAARNLKGQSFCVRGGRLWAAEHGIDFDKFVREGLPASQFLATGDAIGLSFVEAAIEVRKRG